MSVKTENIFKPLIGVKFPLIEDIKVIVFFFFRNTFLCVNFKFSLRQNMVVHCDGSWFNIERSDISLKNPGSIVLINDKVVVSAGSHDHTSHPGKVKHTYFCVFCHVNLRFVGVKVLLAPNAQLRINHIHTCVMSLVKLIILLYALLNNSFPVVAFCIILLELHMLILAYLSHFFSFGIDEEHEVSKTLELDKFKVRAFPDNVGCSEL